MTPQQQREQEKKKHEKIKKRKKGEIWKNARNYSLKDPNRNGKYHIYVWKFDTYDSTEVQEYRKNNKTKNYSKVKGWKSLGRYDDSETWRRLFEHLQQQFGTYNEQDIRYDLNRTHQELEAKRFEREQQELDTLHKWIEGEYRSMGIAQFELPGTLKEARKVYKKLSA